MEKASSDVVRVTGFEPAASWPQTTRATSCATPGKSAVIIQQSPSLCKMLFPGPAGAEKWRFLRNFCLTIPILSARMLLARGGIAQLGERLNGIQEVSGSIPLISTKRNSHRKVAVFLCRGSSGTAADLLPFNRSRQRRAGRRLRRTGQRFDPARLWRKKP